MDDTATVTLAPIPLAYYVNSFVVAKRITGQLTTGGARRAQRSLHQFCRLAPVDPRQVRREHIDRFLKRPDVAASRRTELATLQSLFDYLVFRAVVSSNPTVEVDSPDRIRFPVVDTPAVVADALDREILDTRAALVVSLMYFEDARRCEIARMKFEDIDTEASVIKIRGNGGYGAVTRVVPLSARTARVLATYSATVKHRRGPLIANLLKPQRGISAMRIGVIARKALESLGVERAGDDAS